MQTIPDAVLEQIAQHRPHLATMIANLRTHPDQAPQIEKAIATAYLLGTTELSASDTWYLSQCAAGGPWGGDWLTTSHAAHILGVTEGRIRQRILANELPAIKRGKTWYVRRDVLAELRRAARAAHAKPNIEE
jgi:excisionase family DNA binding protein